MRAALGGSQPDQPGGPGQPHRPGRIGQPQDKPRTDIEYGQEHSHG
jgi:hypothetical protein